MPRAATGPMPRVDTGPMPRAATGPIPRVDTGPMPRAATGPMPRAATGPIPRVDTGPMPRVDTGSLPVVADPVRRMTGPLRALPPGPSAASQAQADDLPGYEFETHRRQNRGTSRAPDTSRTRGTSRARGAGGGSHAAAAPRRFRFTPTVSAGPPEPYPEDKPGFEFDGAFPAARRQRGGAPAAITAGPGSAATQQRPARTKAEPPAAKAQQSTGGRGEWAKLVRSFLPQPEKTPFTKQFVANLDFRGWVLRVGVPILTMVAVGIAVVVVIGARGNAGPAPGTAALGFPPATLAGQDFTAAASTRGISQSLGRVASDGNEVVVVGSESGSRIARAQFFFSHNGGASWSLGTESAAGGGPPSPGHPAQLIAGGQGNWVAVGPAAIWVSGNGQTWTLVSTKGLPGQVSVLRRTSTGFIAAGTNALYVSANGINWQRVAGPAGALDFKYVAAAGNSILLAGEVQVSQTINGHPAVTTVGQAWLSSDGGRIWTPVVIPAGNGAQDQIAGVAEVGTGYVAVRSATLAGLPVADVYRSADGTRWVFAATLSSAAGFIPGVMNGGPTGAVVTGGSTAAVTAFVTADGTRWQPTRALGSPAAESVSGAAMTADGAVLTAAPVGTSRTAPVIQLLAAGAAPRNVSLAAIPGALVPQVAVNAVAAAGNTQIAVGSANGYPAAWRSADGGSVWNRGVGQTRAVLQRPGQQQLTSVTDGSAGWLAVGGVKSGTPQHPVVVVSPGGGTWTAADTEPVFRQGGLVTEQAAASAKGYVIVGYQQGAQGRRIAAAWWSAGLNGWQRATDAAAGALDGAGNRQMLAVTGTANGFVAVGLYNRQPAVWRSADGRQWRGTSLQLPSGASGAVLLHVAASGQTVVAVGTEQTPSGGLLPFAARSADGGVTWTQTPLPIPSGTAEVTALAATASTFTATGTFGTSPVHQDVVVWTSPDGVTWKATTPTGQGLAGPGIQAITGLTVSGSTLTGVGFTASTASEQPLFWQSPIR